MGKHLAKLYIDRVNVEIELIRLKEFLNSQAIIPESFRKIDNKQYELITNQIKIMQELYDVMSKRIKYDEEKKKL